MKSLHIGALVTPVIHSLWTTAPYNAHLSERLFAVYTRPGEAMPNAGRARGPRLRCGVREARERAGLSQEALARAVGASRNAIVAIERAESVPSVLMALALAKSLDTTVEALFGPLGGSDDGQEEP